MRTLPTLCWKPMAGTLHLTLASSSWLQPSESFSILKGHSVTDFSKPEHWTSFICTGPIPGLDNDIIFKKNYLFNLCCLFSFLNKWNGSFKYTGFKINSLVWNYLIEWSVKLYTPCPSRPPESASLALPKPSSRHTTVADMRFQLSSQIVPHSPFFSTSTRPSPTTAPPLRRTRGCCERHRREWGVVSDNVQAVRKLFCLLMLLTSLVIKHLILIWKLFSWSETTFPREKPVRFGFKASQIV